MNAQLKPLSPNPVVLPGTVTILRQSTEPSLRKFWIEETEAHTDDALMSYCGCSDYLGGRVERLGQSICVVKYTS